MKTYTILCLFLFAGVAVADPASIVRTNHAVPDGGGELVQSGSGTVIARDDKGFTVLSCAHVVESGGKYGKGNLTVVTAKGKTYAAKLVRYDRERDLSVFRVETNKPDVIAATLAKTEKYDAGLKLVKYGHTGGGPLRKTEGEAADYSTTSGGFTNLVATAECKSGDSGGGVFRASDGKFIGVAWGHGDKYWLRAVRIEDVRAFLKADERTASLAK